MKSISLFQKRLRNLKGICIRNLNFDCIDHMTTGLQIYFTIAIDAKHIYTSSSSICSMNPSWCLIDKSQFIDLPDSVIDIEIYIKPSSKTELFSKYFTKTFAFKNLVYIGDEIQCNNLTFLNNVILFNMFNGYYCLPEQFVIPNHRKLPFELNSLKLRQSYNIENLKRIQVVKNALFDSKKSLNLLISQIEIVSEKSKKVRQTRSRIETTVCKLGLIQQEIAKRKLNVILAKHASSQMHLSNHTRYTYLTTSNNSLIKEKSKIKKLSEDYFKMRENLLLVNSHLLVRRKQLISELRYIYPIRETQGTIAILGIQLPNPELLQLSDDSELSVSLGYTSHLLTMITRFLDLPLRYVILNSGSRSQICDYTFKKLEQHERIFPLYSKGKEKYQFEYAIYLLNKNIAQVRYYVGLGTSDLRLTLFNLQNLLDAKLTDSHINRDIRTLKDTIYRSSSDDEYRMKPIVISASSLSSS